MPVDGRAYWLCCRSCSMGSEAGYRNSAGDVVVARRVCIQIVRRMGL